MRRQRREKEQETQACPQEHVFSGGGRVRNWLGEENGVAGGKPLEFSVTKAEEGREAPGRKGLPGIFSIRPGVSERTEDLEHHCPIKTNVNFKFSNKQIFF